MAIEFKYVEDSIERMGYEMPELSICSGSPAIFSMLRPQFKEILKFDDTDGVWIENSEFSELCIDTLRLGKTKAVDLLLTPEYSFSYETIQKIVSDKAGELRPDYGKLWCICCQGISIEKFKQYIEEFREGAVVVEDALSAITYKSFVNALFYIFIGEDKTLFLVPQIKTQSMSDPDLICEGGGLSQGSIMYKLGRDSANQVCTIICADVFRFNSGDITLNHIKKPTENLIFLHPQLNTHPRHDSFSSMRNMVYKTDHFKDMVYITSNWATDTVLADSDEGKELARIKTPWSSIYIKDKDKRWFEQEKGKRIINDDKGLGFGYHCQNRLKVWYAYSGEVMQKIDIKKPVTTVAAALVPKVEVQVKHLFTRKNFEWREDESNEKIDNLEEILGILRSDACYGYPVRENKVCRDKFFGISLGSSEEKQLFLDSSEIPTNVGTFVDNECERSRVERLGNFKKLKSILKSKKLPYELNELNENHKFDLVKERFNVVSEDGSHEMRCMVAYVKDENTAKRVSQEFNEKLKELRPEYSGDFDRFKTDMEKYESKKKVCVLYQDDELELSSYPKRNEGIMNPDRELDEESITR